MIFDGGDVAGANRIANHLARQVEAFKCGRNDDAWLLTAWVRDDNERRWSFHWFATERGKALPL